MHPVMLKDAMPHAGKNAIKEGIDQAMEQINNKANKNRSDLELLHIQHRL
jgi:hypothetical protein